MGWRRFTTSTIMKLEYTLKCLIPLTPQCFQSFLVTFHVVKHPQNKLVLVNTYFKTAIIRRSLTFFSLLKLTKKKNSFHVTKKVQTPLSWTLSSVCYCFILDCYKVLILETPFNANYTTGLVNSRIWLVQRCGQVMLAVIQIKILH